MTYDHLPRLVYSGTPPTIQERRFWAQVERTTTCWLWLGTRTRKGYGQFRGRDGNGRVYAHRWVYERYIGPIPDGMVIDHLCDTPSCVQPDHLDPKTIYQNSRRGRLPRVPSRACARGHLFDEANTRIYRGQRVCRACARERYDRRKRSA